MRTAGAHAIPATKYPCPVASKDRRAGFYHPPNSFEHRLLCKAQNVSLRGRHKNLMPKTLWRFRPQRWLRSSKWGPARWTSRIQRTDLFAALVARRKRFPYRPFLAIVPCFPIQLNFTTRDGDTKAVERIGFETDVTGFLDEVVH